MNKFRLLLLSLTLTFLVSCENLDVPSDTPSCIKSKIRKISSDPVRNPPASVWQYKYNGQTVYYIPPYCCDIPGELFDENCKLICNPDGGFTGNGDGKCTNFFDSRTDEILVWKDSRE